MLSRATSLSSMAQQLSQTAGVATAALMLHTVLTLHGGTRLTAADFYPVFMARCDDLAAVGAVLPEMAPDAGAEARRPRRRWRARSAGLVARRGRLSESP